MHPIAIITGATAGIGKSTAELLASKGYHLIIMGRRADVLVALKEEWELKYAVKVLDLAFDIRDKVAVEEHIKNLPSSWKKIDLLVNNAGLAAGLDCFHEASIDDWEQMIDTNVKGLLYISQIVSKGFVERKKGHIINIGSIAGKEVYPKGNVYCGTKHAVDALTKAMRMDLLPYHIRVSSVNPGAVETEFSIVRFKGDVKRASQVYQGYEQLIAADIADAVWYVASRPAHVTVSDITVMPTAQASVHVLYKEEQ